VGIHFNYKSFSSREAFYLVTSEGPNFYNFKSFPHILQEGSGYYMLQEDTFNEGLPP